MIRSSFTTFTRSHTHVHPLLLVPTTFYTTSFTIPHSLHLDCHTFSPTVTVAFYDTYVVDFTPLRDSMVVLVVLTTVTILVVATFYRFGLALLPRSLLRYVTLHLFDPPFCRGPLHTPRSPLVTF